MRGVGVDQGRHRREFLIFFLTNFVVLWVFVFFFTCFFRLKYLCRAFQDPGPLPGRTGSRPMPAEPQISGRG